MRWCGVIRRHHHGPDSAMQPAGQDPEARLVPGAVTLPLRSRTNASPFWIMLLLVWGRLDNGIILFGWPNEEQARSKANAVTASQTKEHFLDIERRWLFLARLLSRVPATNICSCGSLISQAKPDIN